jgi:DNA-damage-inducible protein J
MSSTVLTIRTDERLKRSVGKTLNKLGLNHSTAINIFYHAIEKYHGLPFSVRIPNKETINAMRELESGGGDVYNSADEFFKETGL